MRVLRAKSIRKYLRFYRLVFGIDAPFKIILDGNFIFAAIKYKLDIRDRLEKLLQSGKVSFHVLQSVITEMKKVGKSAENAINFANSYCEIINDDKVAGESPNEKLQNFLAKSDKESLIEKRKKFFVATQDQELRQKLGNQPGIPLIYLNKVTLVLEAPSKASQNFSSQVETKKMTLTEGESTIMKKISKSSAGLNTTKIIVEEKITPVEKEAAPVRRKRKASEPNPLSSLVAREDSNSTKKKKKDKYRR